MHYFFSLNYNNTLYNFFEINNFIKTELFGPDINNEKDILAKIDKKYMIYRLCDSYDSNLPYLIVPKDKNTKNLKIYDKSYPKLF